MRNKAPAAAPVPDAGPDAVPDTVPDAGAAYELDDGALTCRQIAALRRDVARHFSRGGIMQTSSLFDPPEKPKTEEGSSNVYADLNYLDPQGMQRKSTLAFAIAREIRRRKLSFAKAAAVLGVEPLLVVRIRRGQFRDIKEEFLADLLQRMKAPGRKPSK